MTETDVCGTFPFFQKRMIMRGKQTQTLASIDKMLNSRTSDSSAVKCTGTAAKFVHNDKASTGGTAKRCGSLGQLCEISGEA